MTLFFDLNIPCNERDNGGNAANNKVLRVERLRSVVRAMELGYCAVAYNRVFRGVLSDRDCCVTSAFPISCFSDASPALAASVAFQRDLLGVPRSAAFRQYSRITVIVDSLASVAPLRCWNRLLRTYDLVAARPLNQVAFDQLCLSSAVDLISIDFSEKLPYNLKLQSIEKAIQRGIYFEVTYSHVIADVNSRRTMLPDAKQLIDCTRGRNLIISSSSSDAKQLRGPCDVKNFSVFLLGLSMKRAKFAISENCRSLISKSLKRKHFHEGAIRVERLCPDGQVPKGDWYLKSGDFDPLSSVEGDLPPLDEMGKIFSDASTKANASDTYTNKLEIKKPASEVDEMDITDSKQEETETSTIKKDLVNNSLFEPPSLELPDISCDVYAGPFDARNTLAEQKSLISCSIPNTNSAVDGRLDQIIHGCNLDSEDNISKLHICADNGERMPETDPLGLGSEDGQPGTQIVAQVANHSSCTQCTASAKEAFIDQSLDEEQVPSSDVEMKHVFDNSLQSREIELVSKDFNLNKCSNKSVDQGHDFRVKTGKGRRKRRLNYQACLAPPRHLLKPVFYRLRIKRRPIR